MDVRYVAWAGYDFDSTTEVISMASPEFTTEEIGETVIRSESYDDNVKITGKDLKPSLTAFPNPVR